MGITWEQIKLASLKKMDPSVTSLIPNRNTKDYLNAIVPVANRGLQDLATAGKFIIKSYDIMIPEITNKISDGLSTYQHLNEDIEFGNEEAHAYYFEISGKGQCDIVIDETTVDTVINTTPAGFTVKKGIIDNPDKKPVKLVFKGLYPYQIRHIALYDIHFETDNDVWEYSDRRRFNLKELINDFYKLVSQDVVLESLSERYIKTKDFEWEGDSTLVIDGTVQGNYKVHYYAYPQTITDDTPNEFELSLDPEVANLLPLYIAAELFEDDDLNQAFYFREQYNEAKQQLIPTVLQGKPEFVDRWGWI